MGPRECDVLGKVLGQRVDEIPVPAWVELRLVSHLCLFESVAADIGLNRELEVESCSQDVSDTGACCDNLVNLLPFLPVWRQS